ncbi:hypothetical protein ElyMa_001884300 [Elysia marginata]|uniref:Uncharacterized protein n=1 Tax=Elysia marginata TaxID=1093978 RepID=A0AAV4EQJ5_9GAST|nr:hypothetical protein ElyMa_001884300 [Elysia marginata]
MSTSENDRRDPGTFLVAFDVRGNLNLRRLGPQRVRNLIGESARIIAQEIRTTRISTHRVTVKITTKFPSMADKLKRLTQNQSRVHFGSFGIQVKTIRTITAPKHRQPELKDNHQKAKPTIDQSKATHKPQKPPGLPSKYQENQKQ